MNRRKKVVELQIRGSRRNNCLSKATIKIKLLLSDKCSKHLRVYIQIPFKYINQIKSLNVNSKVLYFFEIFVHVFECYKNAGLTFISDEN